MNIIPATVRQRVHVANGYDWTRSAATDFWVVFSPEAHDATAGNANNLAEAGWTLTSMVQTAGSGHDFLATDAAYAPPHFLTDAASDLVQSPAIFGTHAHGKIFESIMGYFPTQLVLETYAAMTVASNNETITTLGGFVEIGGSPIVANDAQLMLFSDGTNFGLRSGAATDAGAAVDTAWHLWKVVMTVGSTAEWFIDGTSQGTVAIQADLAPYSYGFGVGAASSNRPGVAWTHIYYR